MTIYHHTKEDIAIEATPEDTDITPETPDNSGISDIESHPSRTPMESVPVETMEEAIQEDVPSSVADSDISSSDATDVVEFLPESTPVGETPTDEEQGKALVMENPEVPTEESPVIPETPVSETVADVPSDSAQKNEASLQ